MKLHKKALAVLLGAAVMLSSVCFAVRPAASGGLVSGAMVTDNNGYGYHRETAFRPSKPAKAAKAPLRGAKSSLPSYYDSRSLGIIPAVRNQGITGTCWAFAATGALKIDAVKKGYEDVSSPAYSPSHLAWFSTTMSDNPGDPFYGEGLSAPSPYFAGGNWMYATSTLSEGSGIALTADFPFYPYDTSAMIYTEADRYDRGSGYMIDSSCVLPDASAMKSWVMEHGAFTMAIYYDSACENPATSAYYSAGAGGENVINHNITVVGWDDDYPASSFLTQPASDGAWLVMDSWGISRHSSGFYWLSYCEESINYTVGFTARSTGNYLSNYSYNGCYYNWFIGTGEGEFTVANVFEAKYSENINAVSFITCEGGDTVNVKIYKNPPASSLSGGTLAADFDVSADYEGYHTAAVPQPVALIPGDKFAVVLEISNPSAEVYVPVENPAYDDGTAVYTSNPGESFYYLNGQWNDTAGDEYGNLFIQAFTSCNHVISVQTSEPTCTEDGYFFYGCTQCGETIMEEHYPATGHKFSDWIYSGETAASHISTRTCTVCGETETRKTPKGTNTITIDELLNIIFTKIFYALFRIEFK